MPMKELKDFSPEEQERVVTLLKRADALNNAYAIVHDTPAREGYAEATMAETLEVLDQLSAEAEEAMDSYRAELGL